jgi:D-alanyl-D-alanine carboxypeptidase
VAGGIRRARHVAAASVTLAAMVGLAGCTGSVAASGDPFEQVDAALPGDLTERLDTAVTEAVAASGASGAIAGVWAPWAGEWSAAVGTASFDDGASPMTTDMPFRIGAGTGTMTCVVLLSLVDRDIVELDDPLAEYVDHIPGLRGITLADTCRHTSGIADYAPALRKHFIDNPTRDWPPLELIASGLADEAIAGPGERWSYSNTGIALLGLALQRRTGMDWNELYDRYIIDPLGLTDTELPAPSDFTVEGAPDGYAVALGGDGAPICDALRNTTEQSSSIGWVAAGGVSTLDDLAVWTQALATGSLLSEELRQTQWKTVPIDTSAASWKKYGLGADEYGPMRGFAGEAPGYLTAAYTDPASGLTVVVMLNNSSSGAEYIRELAFRLASITSRAPAAEGREMPLVELPWSEQQMVDGMAAKVVCPPAG